MADVAMAMDAGEHLAIWFGWKHLMHDVRMAVDACVLRYPLVAGLNLDRLAKVFKCESQRVKKSVIRFGNPFAKKVMRKVAVVAHSDVAVT
jgi:hypothetical protein